jgi:hypothetical protein
MKKRNITILLILLIWATSFQPLHEIKISTSEIEMNKNIMQIRIKLFADDLSSSLSQIIKEPVYFNGPKIDAATLKVVNAYVKSNFEIALNNIPIEYILKSNIIDNNLSTQIKTVWLTYQYSYKNIAAIKSIELKNTLLFDGIPEQKNISKIMLEDKETKTLLFDNQNNDTKRTIQY